MKLRFPRMCMYEVDSTVGLIQEAIVQTQAQNFDNMCQRLINFPYTQYICWWKEDDEFIGYTFIGVSFKTPILPELLFNNSDSVFIPPSELEFNSDLRNCVGVMVPPIRAPSRTW